MRSPAGYSRDLAGWYADDSAGDGMGYLSRKNRKSIVAAVWVIAAGVAIWAWWQRQSVKAAKAARTAEATDTPTASQPGGRVIDSEVARTGAKLLTSEALTARVAMRSRALATGDIPDELRASAARGARHFHRIRKPEEGLGPGYNGTSCAECHALPATPGRGPPGRFAQVYSAGVRQPFAATPRAGARFGQAYWLPGHAAKPFPAGFRFIGKRRPPDLRGLGWVEGVPAAQILHVGTCATPNPPQNKVCGWAPAKERGAGTLRFGAKMVTATLEEFITGALFFEHGQTSRAPLMDHDDDDAPDPEVSEQEVVDLANYVALTKAPGLPVESGPGLITFKAVGCADCHFSQFTVAGRATPQMWSDLLAHDMGPALAESDYDELTPGPHRRTLPLWGLRHHDGPFLTDGSAPTLDVAIRKHAGEASSSRARYVALEEGPRRALWAWLKRL